MEDQLPLWTQVSNMSQFALNMRIVKLVSKLSLQGLKTVLNLVSNLSQNLRQFWDMKGITVIVYQLRIRVSRRLGISATKHRGAIVFGPALGIEMQKLYD